MSDEELRVARATWEQNRGALWDSVAALRGTAYLDAYDDYMAAKARADALAAEARDRGIGQRPRRKPEAPSRGAPSPDFRFGVSSDATAVAAVADGAVRYSDTERATLRDELRAAVSALGVGNSQVLRGTFAGALPLGSKTDVENRVLLNIGLPQSCLRTGFSFEHDRNAPPGWTCGYRYRAVHPNDPFEFWRPHDVLTEWRDVPLTHGLTAAAIWWLLRTAREASVPGPDTPVPATLLRATVKTRAPLSLEEIKAVADGVIAAAQWTERVNPDGLDRLTAKLARAGITTDRETVSGLLRDASGAGAGHCMDGLIAKDGRVDPDDHLVVAGLVHVKTEETATTTLTAQLFRAEPLATPPPT